MKTPIIIQSALFVPGDRREGIDKAFKTKASAVIIDLENAVAPVKKACEGDCKIQSRKACRKTVII
jgi:citrate lyase beta subunit